MAGPRGQLRGLVEGLEVGDLVDPSTLSRLRQRPTWALYNLVVFDTWRKLFIDRSLPRGRAASGAGVEKASALARYRD